VNLHATGRQWLSTLSFNSIKFLLFIYYPALDSTAEYCIHPVTHKETVILEKML